MAMVRRAMSVGWKLAIVAAVAALIIYRVRFAPLDVQSQVVAPGSIVAEVMGTGTLEARVQATISPKIAGRLSQVLADQGDRIKKGQLLATLDDGDLRQQVAMARAELAAVRAGVDRSLAEIARAEATALQARNDFSRVSTLLKTQTATQYELEKAIEHRDVAEAETKRAQLAKVEIERQVLKAEETLRYYDERLADTRIPSPLDGLVIRRSREPGDVVVPGSTILQVIATDQMWVSVWVDESALAGLSVGQPARVLFRSEPGTAYVGSVTRIAPLADRETREFVWM